MPQSEYPPRRIFPQSGPCDVCAVVAKKKKRVLHYKTSLSEFGLHHPSPPMVVQKSHASQSTRGSGTSCRTTRRPPNPIHSGLRNDRSLPRARLDMVTITILAISIISRPSKSRYSYSFGPLRPTMIPERIDQTQLETSLFPDSSGNKSV